MASHLDLEEQEQLDQLKAVWARWGTLVTTALVIVLGGYLAWLGWNAWQRDQAAKAGAMYDEIERSAQTGDPAATTRIFTDIRDRYPRTAFAGQAGLVAAKVAADKGRGDDAKAALGWVAEHGSEAAYRDIARLRLAGLHAQDGKPDEALRMLDAVETAAFQALAADRRGDVLLAQGQGDAAKAAYRKAWDGLEAKVDYRRVVEAKLDALGAAPAPASGVIAIPVPAASAPPGTAAAAATAASSPAAPAPALRAASGASR